MKLAEALRRALEEALRRKAERPKIGSYYPSLLPTCLLRQYLIYKHGVEIGLEKSGVFKIGSLFHGWVSSALKDGELNVVRTEEPFTIVFKVDGRWLRISGRIDLVLEVDDRLYPVEVKSIARLPSKPLEHHVMQLQPYMLALGSDRALIVYLEKRALQSLVFEAMFNPGLFETVLNRASRLHRALVADRAPQAEPGWMCRFCEFREGCSAKRGV